ncbi:MAG TPA: hypothetical protein PKN73_00660 [Candidatus Paceibacterota bacterium]|jgi:hypothetical protein|nr:hypothetical protein [Candidatus Paceibacterota bacterium]HOH11369.1 hypothetical protein [Candidatus Paceibacterota bacterium]HPN89410.1 hypothetical protein [Candidatus Paceibacterota bacterium]HPY12895.1 hypothetical protein [Candidatus Paceibacterota bacterium]HQB26905.1 hypothetical protein [Candidatus Paceibacterota bacterium]
MDNIFNYLQKYQSHLIKSSLVKDEIIKVVKDLVGLELEKEDFNISNNNIYLKTSTKVKLSVLLQKAQVLEMINKKLGEKTILNIK